MKKNPIMPSTDAKTQKDRHIRPENKDNLVAFICKMFLFISFVFPHLCISKIANNNLLLLS